MTVHPALRQTINDSVSYSDFLQNLKSTALSFLSMNSAIGALLSAGWPVTNQQILSLQQPVAASMQNFEK